MNPPGTEVQLSRFIRASRQRVFDAWSHPELLKEWIAPGATSSVSATEVDFRVGGGFRIAMHGEMGGRRYDVVVSGIYRRIVFGQLLSFTWQFEDPERRASVGESRVTVELRDAEGGTEVLLTHAHVAAAEAREGHALGWNECFGKLVQLCEN